MGIINIRFYFSGFDISFSLSLLHTFFASLNMLDCYQDNGIEWYAEDPKPNPGIIIHLIQICNAHNIFYDIEKSSIYLSIIQMLHVY